MMTRFVLERDFDRRGYNLWLQNNRGSKFQVAKPVEMIDLDAGYVPLPTISLSKHEDGYEALQDLMQQLWNLGFRPEDIGTAGHLDSVERHLQDMRELAFAAIAKQQPIKPEMKR